MFTKPRWTKIYTKLISEYLDQARHAPCATADHSSRVSWAPFRKYEIATSCKPEITDVDALLFCKISHGTRQKENSPQLGLSARGVQECTKRIPYENVGSIKTMGNSPHCTGFVEQRLDGPSTHSAYSLYSIISSWERKGGKAKKQCVTRGGCDSGATAGQGWNNGRFRTRTVQDGSSAWDCCGKCPNCC